MIYHKQFTSVHICSHQNRYISFHFEETHQHSLQPQWWFVFDRSIVSFLMVYHCTVQTLNMVIWYKLRLDISYKKLWSRIFSGFYNVKDKELDIRSTWYKRQHLTVPSRPLYRVCTVWSDYSGDSPQLYSVADHYSFPDFFYLILMFGSTLGLAEGDTISHHFQKTLQNL